MMEDDDELEKAVELSQKTGDTSLLEEGIKKGVLRSGACLG